MQIRKMGGKMCENLRVNFGGFVPISTVDWPGRAVCTVFFRGCPANCHYCHNRHLLSGETRRPASEIFTLIESSRSVVGGVVFSGGECTMQGEALLHLARKCRAELGLAVGVHTNGAYPAVCRALLGAVDHVALDVKTSWAAYDTLTGVPLSENVQQSLALLTEAHVAGTLPGLTAIHTLFPGGEAAARAVSRATEGIDLVLQQGRYRGAPPLPVAAIARIADTLHRPVWIRTPKTGQVHYADGVFTLPGGGQTPDPETIKAHVRVV